MTDVAKLTLEVDATSVKAATIANTEFATSATKAESATQQMSNAVRQAEAQLKSEYNATTQATRSWQAYVAALRDTNTAHSMTTSTIRERMAVENSLRGVAANTAKDLEKTAEAASHGILGMSLLTRELFAFGREAGRGDMSRMAGTSTLLAQALGRVAGVSPLVSLGVIGITVAMGGVIAVLEMGANEFTKFQGALTITNDFAGKTQGQFEQMATSIADSSNVGIRGVKSIIGELVASGRFSSDTIALMTSNAEAFSRITGVNAEAYIKDYEKMDAGVLKFAVDHAETYHDLSLAQIDRIADLEAEGKHSEAMLLVQKDIADNIHNKLVPAYGTLQNALHDTATWFSKLWDSILGIGRPKTMEQQITDQTAVVQSLYNEANSKSFQDNATTPMKLGLSQRIASAEEALRNMQTAVMKVQDDTAAAAKKAAAQDKLIRDKYDNHAPTATKSGPHPTDVTDSRNADVDIQIAQASTQELQARLRLANDLKTRADIEEQIATAQYDQKIAELDKKEAQIKNDKLNTNKDRQIAELELTKLIVQQTEAERKSLATRQENDANTKQRYEIENEQLNSEQALLGVQAQLTKSTFARNMIELQIQKVKQRQLIAAQQEILDSEGSTKEQKELATLRIGDLKLLAQAENELKAKELDLAHAVGEVQSSISTFKTAIGRHDWLSAWSSLAQTIQTVEAAMMQSVAANGGKLSLSSFAAPAAAVGSLVGGKTGSAISTGLGIGIGAGALASGLGAAGVALGGMFVEGGLGAGLLSAAAFLGPLAPVLGIVAGLAVLFSNTKPSNFTASASFNGTTSSTLGGDKPNAQTTTLIQQVSNAVLQSEQALQSFGATLTTTVQNLEIGQRDPSKITLSNGTILHSATGDASAATDAALKAVLAGATFTNQAEQTLVKSMLDAGHSFDDITAALQNFSQQDTAAQALIGGLGDTLLQLTNPVAFSIKQIKDAIIAEQAQLKTALDEGYISTDTYATALGQLNQIQAAQLAQLTANDNSGITGAVSTLTSVYQAQVSVIHQVKNNWDSLTASLKNYRQSLNTSAAAGLSPQDQYLATQAQYRTTLAAAQGGDQTAIGQLQQVSQDYLTASKAYFASSAHYFQDLNEVKAGIDATATMTQQQSDLAQKQLDDLDKQVNQFATANGLLLQVRDGVDLTASATQDLAAAMAAVTSAIQAQAAYTAQFVTAPSTPVTPLAPAGGSSGGSGTSTPVVVVLDPATQAILQNIADLTGINNDLVAAATDVANQNAADTTGSMEALRRAVRAGAGGGGGSLGGGMLQQS